MTAGEFLVGAGTLALALATVWLALEARSARREARDLEHQRWKRELYAELLERVEMMAGGDSGKAIYTLEQRAVARERALALVFQIDMVAPAIWLKAAELWEQAKNVMEPESMEWTAASQGVLSRRVAGISGSRQSRTSSMTIRTTPPVRPGGAPRGRWAPAARGRRLGR